MLKLKGKGDESFKKWIQEVCDVELLMRTYAVSVAVGMWDDYWNNSNNYFTVKAETINKLQQIYFLAVV